MSESSEEHYKAVRIGRRVVQRDASDDGRLIREFHSQPPMTVAEQAERERAAGRDFGVPVFIEVEPDRFELIGNCTAEELAAAVARLRAQARELTEKAQAIQAFAAGRRRP